MSDKYELPSKVDVMVLGTGLPEAIVAAACSKAGLSVLQIDRNDFYGGVSTSLGLNALSVWLESQRNLSSSEDRSVSSVNPDLLHLGEHLVYFGYHASAKNLHSVQCTQGEKCSGESVKFEFEKLRQFSIDIMPKVLPSRGSMVELMIQSDVARYCEFKCIDRFLYSDEAACHESRNLTTFHTVPCSRAEIFQSTLLSMAEKRKIMKFLSLCTQWHEDDGEIRAHLNEPFDSFLESQGFLGNVQTIIIDAIGILATNANVKQGIDAAFCFMQSVGRYGSSPFLWPMYGCGELASGFCRMCAVYGGTYCLKRNVEAFIVSEKKKMVAVVSDGQRIDCEYLIVDPSYLPDSYMKRPAWESCIQRAIVISDKSICHESTQHLSIVNFTRQNDNRCTKMIELSRESCTTPAEYHLCHFTGYVEGVSSQSLFENLLDRLFSTESSISGNDIADDKRPRMLLAHYFDLLRHAFDEEAFPSNFCCIPTSDPALNFQVIVKNARDIFVKNWPNLEFFPWMCAEVDEDEDYKIASVDK